jgi:hypothetical protein
MISPILIQRRQRRYKPRVATQTTPAPPVLIAADYDSDAVTITLTFDQAINIAGLDGSQVLVNDPVSGFSMYEGTGAGTQVSPVAVKLNLSVTGLSIGSEVFLSASDMTGIIAVAGGKHWSGVEDVALPFG